MTQTLGVVLAALFALLAAAKFVPVAAMRTAATHLGYTTGQYRLIGMAELAAAIGVVIGLKVAGIGIAAAVGLVLLMLGAARAHLVHRDSPAHVAVPVVVGAVATAYLLVLQ
jgi:hypothetical protein